MPINAAARKFNPDEANKQINPFLEEIIGSQSSKARDNAIQKLYAKISSYHKDDEYRFYIYALVCKAIKTNPELPKETRQAFMDILADGIVNDGIIKDNTEYIHEKNVKYLCELVYDLKINGLSQQAVENIEKAYTNIYFCDQRYVTLLLAASGSKSADKFLRKTADSSDVSLPRMYYSAKWAATLVLAQKGERKYVKNLVRLAEKSINVNKVMLMLLFDDLPTVHDKIIVKYLHEYLKLDRRLPFWDEGLSEGRYEAYYAANALSKMLRGFPVHKNYNDMKAIEDCRKWMAEQKEYVFLETP